MEYDDLYLQNLIDKYLSTQPCQPFRCPNCGHFLFKQRILIGTLEDVKCKFCKQKNSFVFNDLNTFLKFFEEENVKKT